ncbi:DNA-directed RNA polymerase subunit beta', partial [bacterium]|nr:DNA-directed RNA polymerase subunit beta' [bacterium]
RGLMAKPSGEIIENPILANFREGLNVLQYFVSTHGARKGLADTALKTANSGYLTRRLVDVAQDAVVSEVDCGTLDGIYVTPLTEGGEIIESVAARVLGRVAQDDIISPLSGEIIVEADQEITEDLAQEIDASGIDRVRIRSVLTCQAKKGICAYCYGRDLARGRIVNIGESVGVIAAQSIGEPGTQLTMRTFHIGGTASSTVEQSSLETKLSGLVKFIKLDTVRNREGKLVAMNRNGEIAVVDEKGVIKERNKVVFGAHLMVEEGDEVKPGQLTAEWDPFSIPTITAVSGRIKYGDVIEGVTFSEQVDQQTGMSRRVVGESRNADLRPRISIKDEKNRTIKVGDRGDARYYFTPGVHIMVAEGEDVLAGDIVATKPRDTTKTKDITGGLPRVAELFEARKPKEIAVIAEIEGIITLGKMVKGKQRVIITPEIGDPVEQLIPKGKYLIVHEGDMVTSGEPLVDGSVDPHDILRVLGVKELAKYIVNEVQEVYRLQGVGINDKHIEVIVRQMLRRIKVVEPGESPFLVDETIEKGVFEEGNRKAVAEGLQPAVGEPLFLGITKASLSTDSFISAASFQETTKVLTQASIAGKVDYLVGLKENVIMGRLIPAGSGQRRYRDTKVGMSEEDQLFIKEAVAANTEAEEAALLAENVTEL